MFLCFQCHRGSTCRSEFHLSSAHRDCQACGHSATCFDCPSGQMRRRGDPLSKIIVMYRNTKRLKYRDIDM